jgi:hypothetical protein
MSIYSVLRALWGIFEAAMCEHSISGGSQKTNIIKTEKLTSQGHSFKKFFTPTNIDIFTYTKFIYIDLLPINKKKLYGDINKPRLNAVRWSHLRQVLWQLCDILWSLNRNHEQ